MRTNGRTRWHLDSSQEPDDLRTFYFQCLAQLSPGGDLVFRHAFSSSESGSGSGLGCSMSMTTPTVASWISSVMGSLSGKRVSL